MRLSLKPRNLQQQITDDLALLHGDRPYPKIWGRSFSFSLLRSEDRAGITDALITSAPIQTPLVLAPVKYPPPHSSRAVLLRSSSAVLTTGAIGSGSSHMLTTLTTLTALTPRMAIVLTVLPPIHAIDLHEGTNDRFQQRVLDALRLSGRNDKGRIGRLILICHFCLLSYGTKVPRPVNRNPQYDGRNLTRHLPA